LTQDKRTAFSEKKARQFWKRTGIIIGAVILLAVAVQLYLRSNHEPTYIIGAGGDPSLEDVRNYRKHVTFTPSGPQFQNLTGPPPAAAGGEEAGEGDEDASVMDMRQRYAENMIIDLYTLKYFRHLMNGFPDAKDQESHMAAVMAYLTENFPADDAAAIYQLYEKYLSTEMALAEAQKSWGMPRSPEEVIAMLQKAMDFRRESLGEEIADAMYGAEFKGRVYAVRRGAIVADGELYGADKEARIKELDSQTWEESSEAVNSMAIDYNLYQEKLAMYERDLKEAQDAAERQELIDRFRDQLFAPDVVEEMRKVDRQMEQEKLDEAAYRDQEAQIQADEELSEDQKQQSITDLQNQTFPDPEAFRRMEVMRKELERRKQEFGDGLPKE